MSEMQIPFAPWLFIAAIAAIGFATLHDLAFVAGRLLAPWFGWMLP